MLNNVQFMPPKLLNKTTNLNYSAPSQKSSKTIITNLLLIQPEEHMVNLFFTSVEIITSYQKCLPILDNTDLSNLVKSFLVEILIINV